MYNRVFTLSEQFRSIIKSGIYLGVCLLFRMTWILADDRARIAQKAAALQIVPSPTYPKVSEPYTTWISTFKLRGWVTLRVNSNPIRNHGPIQTSQSPKSDNSLSKGQNVDAERKKKEKKGRKQDKSAAHLEIWRNLFSKAAAEEMSVTYIISVFVRELPGCILFGWIFMSVALFLLMLITYFRIQLSEGESQFRQKE